MRARSLIKSLAPIWQKEDVRLFEERLIASGIQLEQLIDRAATFIARTLRYYVKPPAKVIVIAGRGNNGEDALNTAVKLKTFGYRVGAILFQKELKKEKASKFDAVFKLDEQNLSELEAFIKKFRADAVIDGLFGIGFRVPLPEQTSYLLKIINDLPAFKLAIDLPSGVEADTGQVDENAFKADATATFFAYKPAHWLPETRDFCGSVHLSTLGFESEVASFRASREIFKANLTSNFRSPIIRSRLAHKKTASLLLVAGSREMPGAAYLAAKAAFSAGSGYVAIATEEAAVSTLSTLLPEAVCFPLDLNEVNDAFEKIDQFLKDFKAVVIGPGFSRKPENLKFCLKTIEHLEKLAIPTVIDGDALFALAQSKAKHKLSGAVLTPHPGEARRFFEEPIYPIEAAFKLAQRYEVICVYKTASTLVTDGKKALIFGDSFSNLATAGSGDVLAGVIGALLAQGLTPFEAACEGVAAQVLASKKLFQELKGAPVIASEIASSVRIILEGMCGDYVEG
jgi:NAD(P)H-hydrate epimerase